jgi:hypothetical protein
VTHAARPDDTPPESGPAELARELLEMRRALEQEGLASWLFADLTEDELLELLRIAFELSFMKDEGRYPRLTLVVPARQEQHLLRTADLRFRPEVRIDARALRRLSFAVPPRPHALLVRVRPRGLVATGIGRFETAGAMLPDDQTGLFLRAGGLVLEVAGPGDLSVQEGGEVFTLRAGRIDRLSDGNEALRELADFSVVSKSSVARSLGDLATPRAREKMVDAIRDGWLYVLKTAEQLGHGGAFAILPTDAIAVADVPDEWEGRVRVTYPTTGPDLLAAVREYVLARWGGEPGARTQPTALREFRDAARAAAALSATDGYVVLNRRLRVLGFGAKIAWDARVPSSCEQVNEHLRPIGSAFVLRRAGMRHTAGYMLGQSIPGALAFVLSQDGELRIFFTDGESGETRVTVPLAPLTFLFQGI